MPQDDPIPLAKAFRKRRVAEPEQKPVTKPEPVEEDTTGVDRVQVRLSHEVYEALKAEAKHSGTSMSALAGLAITEWIDARRKDIVITDADILQAINDPSTSASTKEFLRKFLK